MPWAPRSRFSELEIYRLNQGRYEQQKPNENNRYWIAEINLFLGVWQGTKAEFTGLKYSQNVVDLYPQLDKDNIDDNPNIK